MTIETFDDFCQRIDQDLESPKRENLEIEKAAFIKTEMERKHFQGDGCIEGEDKMIYQTRGYKKAAMAGVIKKRRKK
jgi:hypothetical protein